METGNGHNPQPQKPRLIFWEVTKGCNLRCIHCRASATELSSPTVLPSRLVAMSFCEPRSW